MKSDRGKKSLVIVLDFNRVQEYDLEALYALVDPHVERITSK